MSTISTGTSLTTAFVVTGDTSGELVIKTGPGAGTTAMTIDAAQNVAFANPVTFSGNIDTNGNLNFTSTAQRITGDFSNATLSNRLAFQTSTTNGNTIVGALPNGTGANARLQLFSASDPANASTASMEANATSSLVIINADKTGTGAYLPMTFYTGGSERMRIGSAGQLGIGGANYGTAGQVLTSNGAAAAPSWQTAAGPIPSGSVMLFVQTAAPTGWTKSTAHNNKALRVVSGTASSGGSVAFTTAFASQAVSGSVSTSVSGSVSGSVGNTTLSTGEMPSHAHSISNMSAAGAPNGSFNSVWVQAGTYGTNAEGGSGAHGHGWSGSFSGSASSSFSGTAINLAVQYVDVIVATKD